jgi:peroxiredoxin Q/BCP
MQAFQRTLELFAKRHAQVLGISSDSLESHQEFSRKHRITFPLIDDSDGALSRIYGKGRITYIIDRTNRISYVRKGLPDNEVLLGVLATLDQ